MLELREDIARDLHRHLVMQVETSARIALALGLDHAEARLQHAGRCVSEAFDARYGPGWSEERFAGSPHSNGRDRSAS